MEQRDSLDKLEKRRLQLEENVAKLRKSLRHWQQWEIEYEGMKETLLDLGSEYTKKGLEECKNEDEDWLLSLCERNLLDIKERKLLMYDSSNNLRKPTQVVGLLSRRIDYVQENIKALESRLHTAEENLAASIILIQPDVRNEEGLPVTEIHEELDEDGNIIASSILRSNKDSYQISDAIPKAGSESSPAPGSSEAADNTSIEKSMSKQDWAGTRELSNGTSRSNVQRNLQHNHDIQIPTSDSSESNSESVRLKPKKRVSFAEDTKSEPSLSDHPQSLPKTERERLLRDVCDQVRPEVEGRVRNKQMLHQGSVPLRSTPEKDLTAVATASFLNGSVVGAILKQYQNRQARRLLKSMGLNLWESTRLVYIITKMNHYDLESKQMADTILLVKELHRITANNGKWGDAEERSTQWSKTQEHVMNAFIKEVLIVSHNIIKPDQESEKVQEAIEQCMDSLSSTEKQQMFNHRMEMCEEVETSARQSKIDGRTEDEGPCQSPSAPDSPLIPEETPEDAKLRREMLEYNMKEVGTVVAELNLENDDDLSEETYSDDGNEMSLDDTDDEEEDEHGRASARILTDTYLAEMQALEKRLKATAMLNAGPEPKTLSASNGNLTVDPSIASVAQNTSAEPKVNGTKGVRFANDIDIRKLPLESDVNYVSKQSKPRPNIAESSVIEHEAPSFPSAIKGSPNKKTSRFKAARAYQPTQGPYSTNVSTFQPPSKPPPINATNIIERPYDPIAKPIEPDELDPALLSQQVNSEYHHLRNRMIGNEGGFLKPNEQDEILLDDDEGTGGKKMSRFRAARLGMR